MIIRDIFDGTGRILVCPCESWQLTIPGEFTFSLGTMEIDQILILHMLNCPALQVAYRKEYGFVLQVQPGDLQLPRGERAQLILVDDPLLPGWRNIGASEEGFRCEEDRPETP